MKNVNEVKSLLLEFIKDNMEAFYDEAELSTEDNIFDKGYVSSLFAMRLLNFIEDRFDVTIPDDKIQLTNFSSVNNMVSMINELDGVVC